MFGGLKKGNLKVHVPDAKRKEAEELMCGEKWKRGEECMMDWSKYEDPDAIKEQEEEYERQQDMAELRPERGGERSGGGRGTPPSRRKDEGVSCVLVERMRE